MEWNQGRYYIGRKVYVKTKGGREYSGVVLDCVNGTLFSSLILRDKYNYRVTISLSEIEVLQEEE